VALLESLVPAPAVKSERRLANNIVSAIAMHRDPAADGALDRLSTPPHEEETRRQAAFWLGNARGRHGYDSLQRILRDDPSDRVREHAVFALTQSKEPEAVSVIVREARDDKSPRVRERSLFWLAQTATRSISEEAIRHAIESDPETRVKEQAVFALTQMRNGDGVPLLIDVARNNKNPAVRKKAMFWLGQSKDSRATDFFEGVLVKR
jgi:HEAT repeat protein